MDGEQGSKAHNFAAGKIGVKSNGDKKTCPMEDEDTGAGRER